MVSCSRSIIVPAYNEEIRLNGVISSLIKEFPDHEIIFVCDGEDNSEDIVKMASRINPNVMLLSFKERLGKGGALIEGFRASSGNEIGFVDADESVEPADLKDMFQLLKRADCVIASRRLNSSLILRNPPIKRRIASKLFNIFVRILFGLPFKDTQCGAKVFKRDAIYDILDDLVTFGFEIDVEILWRLNNNNFIIIEHPITWKHSDGSKFKLSHSKNMLFSLLKIRFR